MIILWFVLGLVFVVLEIAEGASGDGFQALVDYVKAHPLGVIFTVVGYIILFIGWATEGLHIEVNGEVVADFVQGHFTAIGIAGLGYCSSSLFTYAIAKYKK